jgi:NitT/TauT family transport system permease protein
VPRVIARTAAVMRFGPIRRLLLLRFPAAAPHLVTGIKLAVAYSVIGIVAGEFILATAGIGKRIAFGYQDFDNRTMYGMLLLLLIMVMAVNGALSHWEERLRHRFGQQ